MFAWSALHLILFHLCHYLRASAQSQHPPLSFRGCSAVQSWTMCCWGNLLFSNWHFAHLDPNFLQRRQSWLHLINSKIGAVVVFCISWGQRYKRCPLKRNPVKLYRVIIPDVLIKFFKLFYFALVTATIRKYHYSLLWIDFFFPLMLSRFPSSFYSQPLRLVNSLLWPPAFTKSKPFIYNHHFCHQKE